MKVKKKIVKSPLGGARSKSAGMKRLVLLDAHAIIHRAYHALPDFTSSDTGEPTGALYGLSAMLLKIIKDLSPDYIVAAYDLPEPTERHKAFTEYKAGREKIDDDLVLQLERSRDVFSAFGIPIYEKGGFEADDIIGTIVEKVKGRKMIEVVIASGDMDTLQLVSGTRIRVYTLKKGIRDTIIYDEKTVKERFGFGPELLPDYKGLRGDPSDNIPGIPGIGEKTATELVIQFGSVEGIYTALAKDITAFETRGVKPRVVKLLKAHEDEARFSKELAEIRRDAPIAFSLPETPWRNAIEPDRALALFRELGFRTIAERFRSELGVEGSLPEQETAKQETVSEEALARAALALWVLDSEHTNPTHDDILSYTKKKALTDARAYILAELETQGLRYVFEEIELPIVPIVARMEARGVSVDTAYLKKLSKEYHVKLERLARAIYKHAGTEFNINSPKQLSEVLYDTLGLKGKARTATGQRSTRESELEKLTGEHKIVEDVLSYRELQKLLSTYIDNLPTLISPKDRRLHAEFLQTGTTTGRIASRNPNLQNIPIRTQLGRAVRNAFVATDGYVLVDFDYSQIELRVSAVMTGDEKMKRAFVEGRDIHTEVAREVFRDTDSDARRKAKVINFGIHYGMGVNALARAIDASQKEARQFLESYFEKFPGVARHIEDTKAFVHKNGYTETLFGRRRFFPGISSHLPYVRAEAERMAINAPIQGSAADIIKLAMRQVDEWIEKEKLRDDAYLILQIHDELVYEVRKEKAEAVAPKIQEVMELVVPKEKLGGVPLAVDVSIGENWGELKRLG